MPTPNSLRRPRRGTLVVIAALLVCSAVIRSLAGAGTALARAGEADPDAKPAAALSPEACRSEADFAALIVALQNREAALRRQESQARMRMQALTAADAEVQEKLDALREAETRLRDTIALAETASEDDINRLVAVYEAMKPKEAAALFDTMEPAFSAGFLGRMRPEIAAPILAGMRTEAAYSVSAILAGRNADVPRK